MDKHLAAKLMALTDNKAKVHIVSAIADNQHVLEKYAIITPDRLAMFFSQMAHESNRFRSMIEIRSDASAERKYGAHTRVGKILGNKYPGDGHKYKGRGIIQLTGRWNYQYYGRRIGRDLVNRPELAADPEIALEIACSYWAKRNLNSLADLQDVRLVTKKINGGYNGLEDRRRLFNKALKIWGI